jgi:two-component system, LuxR family, response regulator FixJ
MPAHPTVYVIDDDDGLRASMRWLLESVGLAVQTFSSGHEFLDRYEPGGTGCLVLDVRMPGLNGLDLQDELARRRIDLPVIIVTGYGEVHMAVRAMQGGASDFIEKPFSEQVLLDRVWRAIRQDAESHQERAQLTVYRACVDKLTCREREVMRLVVAGKSNKEIAQGLGLSSKTVEVHRSQVMKKTESKSLADLVRLSLVLKRGDKGSKDR